MPVCKRCSVFKPFTDFYTNDKSCKVCRCQYQKEYRTANPEKIRERKREWKKTPLGKAADYRYYQSESYKTANKRRKKTAQYKDYEKDYRRNLRKRRPDAVSARDALKYAVRIGKVQRQPCAFEHGNRGACHGRLHAHHHDYSRPLDVTWLCHVHHKMMHDLERAKDW